MSASERFAVVDEAGEHLFWVYEDRAQDLLKEGKVRLVRRKGRARILVARCDVAEPLRLELDGRGSALDHTRYSHRRETRDNPPRVWTLLHTSQILAYA